MPLTDRLQIASVIGIFFAGVTWLGPVHAAPAKDDSLPSWAYLRTGTVSWD